MRGPPTEPWGKLQQDADGRVLAWHPLVDHCADVAASCVAILRSSLLRRRLARIGGLDDLVPPQVSRLAALVALHDLGKFNHGFQGQASGPAGRRFGHVAPALSLFHPTEAPRLAEALAFEQMAGWADDGQRTCELLLASICHHGAPVRLPTTPLREPWRVRAGRDPVDGIRDLARRVREWFPDAFEPGLPRLPSDPPFQHAFNGLVTLADWIGSTLPADAGGAGFRYSEHGDDERFAWATGMATEVVTRLGLDPSTPRARVVRSADDVWSAWDLGRNDVQRAVDALPLPRSGSVTILEAETGSGKTEAALARFVALFRAGLVDGLYFALPTRTAATQMQERVTTAIKRVFPDGARPVVVLAVPGYLRADDTKGRRAEPADGPHLSPFDVLWPDERHDRWRTWAAERPKRYLAGAVAVGTVDQVLLGALGVKHAHLRRTSAFRQLLVVDEVHASAAYMARILRTLVRDHVAAGGHVLLMSATLGSSLRGELGRGVDEAAPLSVDEAVATPFPAISVRDDDGDARVIAVPRSGRQKEIAVALADAMGDPGAAAAQAAAAAEAGAKVLVVRNTVADCVATQQALEEHVGAERGLLFACKGRPAPHHARFAREDRRLLDGAIAASFGKERPGGPCIAIATQTVEQSLDLDADLLITDLCPADVLLQRIGRLHRHERSARPAPPRVVVLVPRAEDLAPFLRRGRRGGSHGLGTVYDDLRVLQATWQLLRDHPVVRVPDMNRLLVEHATHPECLAALARELGPAWTEHGTQVEGTHLGHRKQAALNLLDVTRPFGEAAFPELSDMGRIGTRLGADDRLAIFAQPLPGPFGSTFRELTMRAWEAPQADDDTVPGDVQASGDRVEFTFAGRAFTYDRLGLRRRKDHPPTEEDDLE